MKPRAGSALELPTSGPMRWTVKIVLRRTDLGGRRLLLPGLGGGELLEAYDLSPEAVATLGGPANLSRAFEARRAFFARGATVKGYRDGWAVEVDIERGHQRRIWPVTPAEGSNDGAVPIS